MKQPIGDAPHESADRWRGNNDSYVALRLPGRARLSTSASEMDRISHRVGPVTSITESTRSRFSGHRNATDNANDMDACHLAAKSLLVEEDSPVAVSFSRPPELAD
ncbi:hypothetical protein [Cryptosporangium sp. NPDC051539]|uniref:hypothetical protein n=1 Tax=Cryptosporangium sp. NPDC051539 TaxID=3363962 RepID=UPI00379572E4